MLQEPAPLGDRLAKPAQVHALQIAQPAVNDAQVGPAGATAEIVALEQKGAVAPPRRLERERDAMDPAADHDQIVGPGGALLWPARDPHVLEGAPAGAFLWFQRVRSRRAQSRGLCVHENRPPRPVGRSDVA
jgi:hypothetical protein